MRGRKFSAEHNRSSRVDLNKSEISDNLDSGCKMLPRWLGVDGLDGGGAAGRMYAVSKSHITGQVILSVRLSGFAAFFSVFEVTRKAAREVESATQHTLRRLQSGNETSYSYHLPRFTHAFTLVCGGIMAGLAYEKLCQPWDVARRAVSLQKSHPSDRQSVFSVLIRKLETDGIASFFR